MSGLASRLAHVLPALVDAIATAYGAGLAGYAAWRPLARDHTGLIELVEDFAPWLFAPVPLIVARAFRRRSVPMTVSALVATAAFGATWGRLFRPGPRRPCFRGPNLKVMTYNVLAWNESYASVAATIAAEDPDVVALQELSPGLALHLRDHLGDRYPYRVFRPEPNPAGAGLMSRYPLRGVRSFKLSAFRTRWTQRAVVDAPSGPVTIFNVHMRIPRLLVVSRRRWLGARIGFSARRRRSEVRRFLEHLNRVEGPCLVLGDFNMTERSPDYRMLRTRLGDTYRDLGRGFGHTFPRWLSFPRALPTPWPMLRLDYVWHSPELRPLEVRIAPAGASDHYPVVARFCRADRPSR